MTSPETTPKTGSSERGDRERQEGSDLRSDQLRQSRATEHPATQRHGIYATETVGLLMIAVLLLVLTLIRYWHAIRWSLR